MNARSIRLVEFANNTETVEFVLPEDLSALDAEFDDAGNLVGGALYDLEAEAVAAFDAVRASPLDTEALQTLSDLASAIEAIRAEAAGRVAAATEAAAAAEELAARVHPVVDPEPEAEVVQVEELAADVEQTVELAVEPAEVVEAVEPEVVTAAAVRPSRIRVPMAAIRSAQPRDNEPAAASSITITAAADLPGRTPGSQFGSLDDVARSMHARARHLGDGHRAPVASIAVPAQETITAGMKPTEVQALLASVTEPQSLVAAGGWCAPSSIRRDFFSVEATDGLWDAPEVAVEGGGLEFLEDGGPSIADVLGTNANWLWTEANDIAAAGNDGGVDDVTKPCVRIPCPTWDEERLAMHGLCVSNGNLADLAFPSNTRRFLDLVLAGHIHSMNGRRIAAAVAASQAVTMGASTFGATANVLGAVELQIADMQDKYRMATTSVLEVVFPRWVRPLVRSDLAKRLGVDLLAVTDEMIVDWFAVRGAMVQFVYDWQSLQTPPNVAGSPDGYREAYPATVSFLVYPAGTFVNGRGPSLELGVTRDSAQIAVNDHTAAFTEEGWLTIRVGHESRVVTVPALPTGSTHGGVTNTEAASIGY